MTYTRASGHGAVSRAARRAVAGGPHFARICTSLIEEAEAIGWYQQRPAVEHDDEAASIMRDAQEEEFNHFSMDLEFLFRRVPLWREIARRVLFQPGAIVQSAEVAEEEVIPATTRRRPR